MRLASAQAKEDVSSAVAWQARVDLAAAHRLGGQQGFSEGIFNHFTVAVPGTDDRYLQIPFGLHWSEVTASCLMEVGYDGRLLRGAGEVERRRSASMRRSIGCSRAPPACCTPICRLPARWPASRTHASRRSARPRWAFSMRRL